MKFTLFALALSSVACYTKQVSYICNSSSSVNQCNTKLRSVFPGSTWTISRIMGKGTWMGPNPPTCAQITNAYVQFCESLPLCHYRGELACLPIDTVKP